MKTLTVYLFNEDGLFCDSYNAQESPEEPGKFITPVLSTPLAPPPETAGYNRVFTDGQWALVEIPPPTLEELAAEKLQLLAVVVAGSETIRSRLTEHYMDAEADGDAAAKAAILTCRASLKNITQDQRVLDAVNGEVKDAVSACYQEIKQQLAAKAPQALVAFNGIDAT